MNAHEAELLRHIDPAVLGARIRAARTAAGLTQSGLAAHDITVSYVSRIEAGQRRPDPRVLERIARTLGMTTLDLLDGSSSQAVASIVAAVDYAELALELGDPADATDRIAEILTDSGLESSGQLNRAQLLQARALEAIGDVEQAVEVLEELLQHPAEQADLLACGIALSRLYRESGDLTRAVQVGERQLGELDAKGLAGSDEAVQLAVTVAAAYFEQGDTAYAVRLCRRATHAAEALGSAPARAATYWNASIMELERGNVVQAVALGKRALMMLSSGRDASNLARLRSELGIMQLELDPPALEDAVENLLAASREMSLSSAPKVDRLRNELAIARARFIAGDAHSARQLAKATFEASVDAAPLLAANAQILQGQAAATEADIDAARQAYLDALRILSSVGADRGAAQLWLDLGGLLEAVGEEAAARNAYRNAAVSTGLRIPTPAVVPVP